MRNAAIRIFAVSAYVTFTAAFAYFAAFLLGWVPGRAPGGVGALVLDLGLVALFGATHSLMARRGFKRLLTRAVAPEAERSLFVLVASVQLALLTFAWRPLRGPALWSTSGAIARGLVLVQVAGLAILVGSTYLIDHLELFGLRQAFAPGSAPPRFQVPGAYRLVRHPMYLGMLVTFWAAPSMSLGRFCLAAAFTIYVLVGIRLEERDLVKTHGDAYRRYQADVPMLVPRPPRGSWWSGLRWSARWQKAR